MDKITAWIKENIKTEWKGKNAFVTGGNSGLGFELSRMLLSLGANLTILCRDKVKADVAIESLKKEYPSAVVDYIHLDLSSLSSIGGTVDELFKRDIDVFVNNAGVYHIPHGLTEDGFETVVGVNFLGTMYLNDLLIPYLKTMPHEVRVSFVTSISSKSAKIDYSDFFMDKAYKPMKAYARSKRMINNLYRSYLEENEGSNIIFSLSHPGSTYTPLISKGYGGGLFSKIAKAFMDMFFHTPRQAALSLLKAIDCDKPCFYGPTRLFGFKGYPKAVSFGIDSDHHRCVDLGRSTIAK